MRLPLSALLVAIAVRSAAADPPAELNRLIDQGLYHSQVMAIAEHLTDQIGPRLTNSPQMREAEAWTQGQLRAWGLKNVRKDGFVFGRGWSIVASSVRMTAPRPIQLTAIPVAWTPATKGALTAPIVVAPMTRPRDFEAWRGKLAGKIVLVTLPDDGSEPVEPAFKRFSDDDIAKRDHVRPPDVEPAALELRVERTLFAARLDAFLAAEHAVAWARMAYRDGKLVHGEGYAYQRGQTPALPGVEIAAEDYRRLARLAKVGPAPTLEITSNVQFDDRDANAYNILAEIPGSDPAAGYVMAGAHLDSWVAGDGAADNGAGSSAVLEAARILSAIGVRPRRTIRFVLWAGEEQGLLGSLAYVDKYLATRPAPPAGQPEPEQRARWGTRFPLAPRRTYQDLVAYFNMDYGAGRLHGLFAEGNLAAVPVLREWLQPFAGLGAATVSVGSVGGTDHVFMQAVGVPGYQFIQDPLDYGSRVHHSGIDTFDHLKPDDLRQAAVVLAGVLLQAANSSKTVPRMPLPTTAGPTNPFKYDDPDAK